MGYHCFVRCDRKNSVLLLLALLLPILAPEEVECVRGADTRHNAHALQVNCVHALCPTQELEWQASAHSASNTRVCSADRRGILGEVFYPACVTEAPARSAVAFCLLLLAQGTAPRLPLLSEIAFRSIEGRGPPLPRTTLAIPPLRAPPVA
jgi:hypothetical protein